MNGDGLLDSLEQRFGLKGAIEFSERDGLTKLIATTQFSTMELFLQGAHITSFIPVGAGDLLWLSSLATYQQGKAIRGGVPICWPWFGPHENDSTLAQHGFARNSLFELKYAALSESGEIEIILELNSNSETLSIWPYPFCLQVRVMVGQCLRIELRTENKHHEPIEITEAIHSYFNIAAIETLQIDGLQNLGYFDQLTGKSGEPVDKELAIQQEVDRIYRCPEASIRLFRPGFKAIEITQENGDAMVLWNPWVDKSKSMGDYPDKGFHEMVCVEAANAYYSKVRILPGTSHTLVQTIGILNGVRV